MNFRKALAAWAVAATLLISGGRAFASAFANAPVWASEESEDREDRESDLYDEGTDAIDEQEWDDAIRAFKAVVEMGGSRADGGLYWMAYALNKSGRRAEAMQTIEGLKKSYPKSKWIDDAKALELETRQARGERVAPERLQDDDLKMIAINSLMHSDPEKAYPLLEKIVRGTSDKKIKERALFILAQSPSPRAQTLIASIARGNANPDLQRMAVKYIGIHGGEANRAVLSDLYASGSREVKKEVLRALMIASDKARVHAAAKSEPDPELRREAIHLLGVMNARSELHSLYAAETSADVKKQIIQGLFISNDGERLGDLARGEKNPELRREAIRKLGLVGAKTGPTLLSLYAASDTDVESKKAIIEAFFLQSNARALIDLSKKETNQTLRKAALQKLSIMNNEEALEYMLQILEE
ncbi:MAG TPA: HEAT repeat domain-containing protein [Thermoanaerobaculia bacterium]|nr:HEAT repeat domain-containing protein [Thermoanaerobaculia bacterium]